MTGRVQGIYRHVRTAFAVFTIVCITVVGLLPLPSMAWGRLGHEVMASMSYEQLTPKAKAEVDRLLALEPDATLGSISTWADEHRNQTTAKWHYVNLPRGDCTYNEERDCPGGDCVVKAIQDQLNVLKSNAPDVKRLMALKYVVHFMADIHQPLHAGHADDRGGNQYQLSAFMRGTNLHAFWDHGMIALVSEDPITWVARLKQNGQGQSAQTPQFKKMQSLNPIDIAQESCRIVARPDFYPPHKLNEEYVKTYTPVMEWQMGSAVSRLARTLNGVWP